MARSEKEIPHRPVLYQEIINAIRPESGKRFADLTLGAGGHAWGLLDASAPKGQLLGLDVDPQALAHATERLAEFGERAHIVQASYVTLTEQLTKLGWGGLDGIVLDLGASSMQFDTPGRGFSFMKDGPLDMRFNPKGPLTAADIINTWDEKSLADVIYKYGEERKSRQIAKAIVKNRPFETTKPLAEVIAGAVKSPPKSRLHPATLTFQALRIAVNGEMEAIEQVLPKAVDVLNSGGVLAVISFHSLEDRIVKNHFRDLSKEMRDETHPMAPVVREPVVKLLNRKPLIPQDEEVLANPRARSAKLRMIEKLDKTT